jgi:hypothetical protein
MPARIPCPNPICPYDFTPEEYSAAISCPRCGTRLTAPPNVIPTAKAVPPPAPAPGPGLAPANLEAFATAAPRVARRRGVPFGLLVPLLVAVVFFAFLAAGLLILRDAPFGGTGDDAVVLKEFNCAFRKPNPKVWQRQDGLRRKLGCELAFERADPTVRVALAARDYQTRNPRAVELHAEAVRRIKALVQNADIPEPGEATLVAGRPARRLVFQGEAGDATLSGECSLFAHQGVAYWLLIWTLAAEVERAKGEFTTLRNSLTLLGERDRWLETGGGTLLTAADRSFSVRDVDGWWEKNDPPSEFAPEAQLALRLSPKKLRDSGKDPTADVVVFKLPKSGPPPEAARQFVEGWLKKGAYKDAVVEEWRDQAPGELPPTTPGPVGAFGPPQRLRVKRTPALSGFALLTAAEHGDHVYAVWCECQRPRDWEPAFRILLETFRFEGE